MLAVRDVPASDVEYRSAIAEPHALALVFRHVQTDNVAFRGGISDSLLSFAELSESFDSVTASCSLFKLKLVRRAHHFFGEGANHVLCSSAQYLRRTVYGFTVFLRRYFSRADSHASPDLVVDAGSVLSDVLGEFFLARRNAESSFKLSNGREYCRGRRIRSEIQRAVGKSLSRHGYSRVQ